MWLLKTVANGLINCNAKWQRQSDALFVNIGLQQEELIPQRFALLPERGEIILLAI